MNALTITQVDAMLAAQEAASERMRKVRAAGPALRGFTAGTPSNPRDYTRAAILQSVEALEAAGVTADVRTVRQAAVLSEPQVRQGLRAARYVGLVRRTESEWRRGAWEWSLTAMGESWLSRYRYLHVGPGE